MQVCSRCQEEKDENDFSPSRRGKNGYPCKACVALESQARRDSSGGQTEYTCGRCRESKPADEFTQSKQTNGAYCKLCCSTVARESRATKTPEELRLERKLQLYNMTRNEFNELLLAQMGRCAICSVFLGDELHTDHDEKTGKVRGLLCGPCNRGIGMFDHNEERLIAAAMYLLREKDLLKMEETV